MWTPSATWSQEGDGARAWPIHATDLVIDVPDAPAGVTLNAERRRIAEAVGIGAIKYADLAQNRTTDYVFSFDKMLEPVLDDAPFRAFATMREYREWCQTHLPDWLGYGRV